MNNISEQNDACITVGLLKTTAVNFPGHLAAAVFLPGCNLRCDYCYNGELACADFNGSQLKNNNNYANLATVFILHFAIPVSASPHSETVVTSYRQTTRNCSKEFSAALRRTMTAILFLPATRKSLK